MIRKRRSNKAGAPPLSQLRFEDLLRENRRAREEAVVNLKIPADVLARVHCLADKLGVTKTAAVVALLNEGLEEAARRGITPRE